MNKILIEIYIPAADKTFDLFIPVHLMMYEVLGMIKKAAAELSDGFLIPDDNTVICSRNDGSILSVNLSVDELGLMNGSRLMII